MSFWGPSATMKEDQGFPREMGAWDFQQFRDWLAKQNDLGAQGQGNTDWAVQYNKNRAQNGFASPDQIRTTGQQIMPGVDDVINRSTGRLNDIQDQFGKLPGSAWDVNKAINDNIDMKSGNIGRNFEGNQGDINDTYSRTSGRDNAAHNDIVSNISDSYGAAKKGTNDAYGSARTANQGTFDTLADSSGNAYTDAGKTLEQLKPGGEFQQAQVARSYAPQISDTLGRLRRAGVDPNSVQAVGALSSAERDRARGMDEAAGRTTSDYVHGKVALGLGKQHDLEGLRTSQLNNDIGLGTDAANRTAGFDVAGGKEFRNEQTRNAGVQNTLDEGRQKLSADNRNAAFTGQQNVIDERSGQTLRNRDQSRQDWGTQADLLREQTQNDLGGLALKDQQYNAGQQWNANDLAERNAGAGNVQQIGQQQTNNSFQAGSQARGFGQDAANNYGQSYNYEAPNAGWGTKMLAGMLAGGANAFAPGSGAAITAAGNGMAGGGGVYTAPGASGGGATYNTAGNNMWGSISKLFKKPGGSSGWNSGASDWENGIG